MDDKTKIFIDKAINKHGDKYDYSKVKYINSKSKVTIICKIHGEFEQKPSGHLYGYGCIKCGLDFLSNKFKDTLDEFIEKAKNAHGEIYDYSLVEYINSQTKIKIICKIHGIFEQKPNSHINGRNCPECSNLIVRNKKKTTDEFINEANILHNYIYDYSQIVYKDAHTKIKIICKEHGIFEQAGNDHLKGHGCPKCANNQLKTTEQFIEEAKLKHDNMYDYKLVDYTTGKDYVTIICKKHGEFNQKPTSH